ncbi:glycerophosphodiester phosphodiesterase family protein [Janibacter anophelis]|uniref:glycerophosphodiester phosphodiesterase family protein n=1 Tax=Janibacter anophelis TaxID=319054 RepID=UPI003F7FDF21
MRTAAVASLSCLLIALGSSTTAAAPTADNPWLGQRVMNMAHSGGEDEAPMNTMYAFERADTLGADMLEIDVQLTADGDLAVIHDATVDDSTDHTGRVDSFTMEQLRAMDAAHWFVPGRSTVHDDPSAQYPLRGARSGDAEVAGHEPTDFGVPSLSDVLERFPDTPVNIEIKGSGSTQSYLETAEVLAGQLARTQREDLIVGSFEDEALELFHELAPQIDMSAGQDAMIGYYLSGTPLPEGVVALQVPITYSGITVVNRAFVDRAHRDGYAVHAWFSGSAPDDAATYEQVIGTCVDALMPSRPSVLEEVFDELGTERPTPGGTAPRPECAPDEPTDPEPTDPAPTSPAPTTPDPEPTAPAPTQPSRSETTPDLGTEPREPERPAIVQTDGWVSDAPAAR